MLSVPFSPVMQWQHGGADKLVVLHKDMRPLFITLFSQPRKRKLKPRARQRYKDSVRRTPTPWHPEAAPTKALPIITAARSQKTRLLLQTSVRPLGYRRMNSGAKRKRSRAEQQRCRVLREHTHTHTDTVRAHNFAPGPGILKQSGRTERQTHAAPGELREKVRRYTGRRPDGITRESDGGAGK